MTQLPTWSFRPELSKIPFLFRRGGATGKGTSPFGGNGGFMFCCCGISIILRRRKNKIKHRIPLWHQANIPCVCGSYASDVCDTYRHMNHKISDYCTARNAPSAAVIHTGHIWLFWTLWDIHAHLIHFNKHFKMKNYLEFSTVRHWCTVVAKIQ